MFAAAYSQAIGFTRPVIISRRRVDGSCDSSIGSFVIVNDEGWIVTAAHIINEYAVLTQSKLNYEQHVAAKTAISTDNALASKLKQKRLKNLGVLDPKATTDFSFWWCGDGVVLKDIQAIGSGNPMLTGDVAVGRLDPFDPTSVTNYPTFKDHTKAISSGTSLFVANCQSCRKTPDRARHCCDLARPTSVLSPGFSQGQGRRWRSISRHLARYGLGRSRRRTRVMPRSACDTAHDSGAASDTD